jgi:hypothetical protein
MQCLGENTHIAGQEPIEIINQLEKWLSIVKGTVVAAVLRR